jgi:hypothetical protein
MTLTQEEATFLAEVLKRDVEVLHGMPPGRDPVWRQTLLSAAANSLANGHDLRIKREKKG